MKSGNAPKTVIGVCGHKDITTPRPLVYDALTRFWNILSCQKTLSSYYLLDSLAEGGDQYVLDSKPAAVSYTAVLPFASEIYENDFESSAARKEYHRHLNAAASVVTAGNEPGNYVGATEYLLTHSDILLALWDCIIPEGLPAAGGSWDTISRAQNKDIPVFVIPVRRKKTYSAVVKDISQEECIPMKLQPDFTLEKFSV